MKSTRYLRWQPVNPRTWQHRSFPDSKGGTRTVFLKMCLIKNGSSQRQFFFLKPRTLHVSLPISSSSPRGNMPRCHRFPLAPQNRQMLKLQIWAGDIIHTTLLPSTFYWIEKIFCKLMCCHVLFRILSPRRPTFWRIFPAVLNTLLGLEDGETCWSWKLGTSTRDRRYVNSGVFVVCEWTHEPCGGI